MYFKITNEKENHHGFQYVDGLNVLIEEFNYDPNASCCAGGFYFTDAANICKFLNYGVYLREIELPIDNPDFKMIKDKENDKWRTNMIILGKRYDLFTVDTLEYLKESGANVHAGDDCALRSSAQNGHLDVVKYLIECGANIHAEDDYALQWSARNGYLDIVKYLIECGADIHVGDDSLFFWSARNGHLDIVKYVIKHGANVHAADDYALRMSARNGHLDVHEYLKSII